LLLLLLLLHDIHCTAQVLHTLNMAEGCRVGEQRNILQLLSSNTRRTKVVELSTGTHRSANAAGGAAAGVQHVRM
jgi:hypothetical protein